MKLSILTEPILTRFAETANLKKEEKKETAIKECIIRSELTLRLLIENENMSHFIILEKTIERGHSLEMICLCEAT